ncbi:MAG: CRISPR-associated endonuclease Cas1 [Nitrospiraceae bacterium]|nr:CRISPR-associated endonuclease Cas1 [Nitrospiraceae bacterium]
MTDEYLWPARNVAEYAYCPRLFYLMEVEGVFLPSADTEQGNAVHRRVNKPSLHPEKDDDVSDPDQPKTVRSLTLTNNRLGLTATMDLAEISGNTAVPVEYRKGKPKHKTMAPPPEDPEDADNPPLTNAEPWPIDKVQIGLQALLLKEAGYEVPKVVLYYAAEKRRLEIPFDSAFEADALASLEAAKTCAQGPRPLPLLNDYRCPRCSLQPICLPDEVNHQRTDTPAEEMTPRKIWPPRDDGIHIVAQTNGAKISVKGMTLSVKDKEGATLKEIPLANIESLSLLGSVQISTQAIHVLADKSIPVAYLSSAGRLVAMVDPLDSVSAEIRKAQVRRFGDPEVCLELARALVTAKISNQRTLLMRNNDSLSKDVASEMSKLVEIAARANSPDVLRGLEGRAGAIYFKHFAGMFKCTLAEEFDANGRQRRPPPDPINSCISMAYSMLTHECVAALRLARLEPSIGAYHVSRPGRPAFALDLMEPFRPLIADSVALSAFNRNELCEGHFLKTSAGCAFTDAGRKAFFNAYARRMDVEVRHPVFEYRLSYRRMLALHARMIAAWLLGEVPTLAFLTTR